MKTILTCFAIFSFGILAMAQEVPQESKTELLTFTEMAEGDIKVKKRFPKKKGVTRIYLFKNSRVKKELSFKTKRNKTKLA